MRPNKFGNGLNEKTTLIRSIAISIIKEKTFNKNHPKESRVSCMDLGFESLNTIRTSLASYPYLAVVSYDTGRVNAN